MIFRFGIYLIILSIAGCSTGHSTRISSLQAGDRIHTSAISHVLRGKGSPSVIFESGLGDGYQAWMPVLEVIAHETQAFAYNRNVFDQNHGTSSGFVSGRSSEDIARSLRSKLKSLKVPPPYILVGHSYGGLYMLKYAELYSGDVAGVVLVDSRPANFTAHCKKMGLGNCGSSFFFRSFRAPNEQREIRGMSETEAISPPPHKLGSIPVTVISATVPEEGHNKAYQEHWMRLQANYANSLKNGRFVTAHGSKSYIHKQRPELVIDEIRQMLAKVK